MDHNPGTAANSETRKIKLETILVPIDFSDCSLKALRYAIGFAQQFGAKLLLVAVIETPLPTYDLGYMSSTTLKSDEHAITRVTEKLAAFAAQCIRETLNYACFTAMGEPTEEILGLAREQRADLIIMGTHGRTGVKHLLLGSVAEKTVCCAHCPVLVVRLYQREFVYEAATGQRLELMEIIVPDDFSEGAAYALQWAEMLARQTGARLNLLHVVPYHYALGEYDALAYPELEAEMVETGRDRLATLAEAEQERGVKVDSAVVRGAPRNEIIEFAHKQKGDIVVMGTRGLTGLKHLLLGSNAEYVVRQAPCAVLTVPSPKHDLKRKKVAEPTVATT